MQIIAARLGLDRNQAGDSLAEFRVIILQRNLGLLNCLQVRVDDNDPENRILIVRAVQFKTRATEVLTVHENLLATLWVFGRSVAPAD